MTKSNYDDYVHKIFDFSWIQMVQEYSSARTVQVFMEQRLAELN